MFDPALRQPIPDSGKAPYGHKQHIPDLGKAPYGHKQHISDLGKPRYGHEQHIPNLGKPSYGHRQHIPVLGFALSALFFKYLKKYCLLFLTFSSTFQFRLLIV